VQSSAYNKCISHHESANIINDASKRFLFLWTLRISWFLKMLLTIEAEILDEIQIKVLRVFLLAIHSQKPNSNSFALRFLFLHLHATSYSF
jgi:hypothetical protein